MINETNTANMLRIVESLYRLKVKIASSIMTIKLENETHVPDLMTRIRILPAASQWVLQRHGMLMD